MGSPLYRGLVIVFGIFLVFGYSFYKKDSIDSYFKFSNEYILESLPDLKVSTFESLENKIRLRSFLEGPNSIGLYVHFWATWCGPCKKELPEFLKFAESFRIADIKFLLLAVRDEEKLVKKFMKKLSLPKNVIVAFDDDGLLMREFGTLRVPETYLFNKNLTLLKKFIGPQNWIDPYFTSNSRYLLNIH